MSTISSSAPRAVILAVIVILAFEAFLRWAPIDPFWRAIYRHSDPKKDDALRFFAQARTLPAQAIVVMGSSQAREVVDVRVLNGLSPERRGGATVANLAVSDGATVDLYAQLDLILPKRPKLLVILPLWPSFYLDYDARKLRYYVYSLGTVASVAQLYGPKQFWRSTRKGLPQILPALISPTCRFGKSLWAAGGRMLTEPRAEPELFAYEESRPAGYFEEELREPKQRMLHVTEETALEQALFERFVDRVQSQGTKLLVVDAPMHPAFYAIRDSYAPSLAHYRAFMERASRERGFIYHDYDDLPKFGAGDFIDFSHLNAEGRRKMTEFLAGHLEAALQQ